MSAIDWETIKDALHAWFVAGSGLDPTRVLFAGANLNRPAGDDAWISLRVGHQVETDGYLDELDEVDNPLAFADKAVSFLPVPDQVTAVAHGLHTGDGPFHLTVTGGSLPPELHTVTNYWVIRIDADTLQLASTFLHARAPTPIVFSTAGTGTSKLVTTDDSLTAGAEILRGATGGRLVTLEAQCFPPRVTDDATETAAILSDVASVGWLESRQDALDAAGISLYQCSPIRAIDGIVNTTRFEPRAIMTVAFWTQARVTEPGTIIETVNVTGDLTLTVDLSDP